jgi:hypothetical protein
MAISYYAVAALTLLYMPFSKVRQDTGVQSIIPGFVHDMKGLLLGGLEGVGAVERFIICIRLIGNYIATGRCVSECWSKELGSGKLNSLYYHYKCSERNSVVASL